MILKWFKKHVCTFWTHISARGEAQLPLPGMWAWLKDWLLTARMGVEGTVCGFSVRIIRDAVDMTTLSHGLIVLQKPGTFYVTGTLRKPVNRLPGGQAEASWPKATVRWPRDPATLEVAPPAQRSPQMTVSPAIPERSLIRDPRPELPI